MGSQRREAPGLRLGRILPIGREDRWSDLLAVLIDADPDPIVEADPDPIVEVLRIGAPGPLEVVREAAVDAESRPDIVLRAGGRTVAVIEVKLLAGFGRHQLARYIAAEPGADAYVVLHPGRLALPTGNERWRAIPWEDALAAYQASTHPWVAATALAWQNHLAASLPVVGPDTIWNDLQPGEDFKLALRARMSWVHDNMHVPNDVHHDIVTSSAGRSWVVRVMKPVSTPGYRTQAEIEERLPVQSFPNVPGRTSLRLAGRGQRSRSSRPASRHPPASTGTTCTPCGPR